MTKIPIILIIATLIFTTTSAFGYFHQAFQTEPDPFTRYGVDEILELHVFQFIIAHNEDEIIVNDKYSLAHHHHAIPVYLVTAYPNYWLNNEETGCLNKTAQGCYTGEIVMIKNGQQGDPPKDGYGCSVLWYMLQKVQDVPEEIIKEKYPNERCSV